MTGHSHTEKEGTPFAMAVMQHMNDKCAEWKAESDIELLAVRHARSRTTRTT